VVHGRENRQVHRSKRRRYLAGQGERGRDGLRNCEGTYAFGNYGATAMLGNLSGCKVSHQRQVGFEKIVGRQFRRRRPADVFEDFVFDFSGVLAHGEEAQFNRAASGIFVTEAGDFFADHGVDAEFLVEFAAEGVARLFSFFDFAAGELPFKWHGLVAGALAD
jgi:hypothetical protein